MSKIKAIFFDQDGVIVDTERKGHRVAFNRTFKSNGLDIFWDEEKYHKLLRVGGGKERMHLYFEEEGLFRKKTKEELDAFIKKLHAEKTEELITMIDEGELPLRPGIKRLMTEANHSSVPIGICTTSNEKNTKAIIRNLLPEIDIEFILAGDCVSKKKPDPEIYLTAIKKMGINPSEGLVIEDSYIGTLAAKRAGLHVVATVTEYTNKENMENADIVFDSLGDHKTPAVPISYIKNFVFKKSINLSELNDYFKYT